LLINSQPTTDVSQIESETEEEEDPRKNFTSNLIKSIIILAIGTIIVSFFSDPMVGVIADFSTQVSIKPFFVSFLITPYCSNASEMIAALMFASKKRKENTSMTYSQLYGAVCMNASMILGIFYALVYFRGLSWTFTAETLSILLVTWIVGLIASFKKDFAVWWSIPIFSLYPLSLVFVWGLEELFKWT